MAKLSGIAKLIKASKNASPDTSFLNELIRTVENLDEQRMPSKAYKPSSLGGCMRNMYFQMVEAKLDGTPTDYCLIGICESGTGRHDVIQNYVAKMREQGFDCDWVDVEEYIKEFKPEGTTVIEKQGMETKCYNEIFNLRFLCDGIIKYRGEYYILEIKTESTYKYSSHDEPYAEHKVQATTYSMAFGINDVIFLYENRDNTSKKTYLIEVTDEMKQEVADKIFTCDEHIAKKQAPPKSTNLKDCQYCNYKRACREVGEICRLEKTSKKTSKSPSKKTTKLEF